MSPFKENRLKRIQEDTALKRLAERKALSVAILASTAAWLAETFAPGLGPYVFTLGMLYAYACLVDYQIDAAERRARDGL